jgi:hypothetical protein
MTITREEKQKGKCSDCQEKFDIHDLIQIAGKEFAKGRGHNVREKYRLVCEKDFDNHTEYKFIGRL